jgi:ribosomal protein S27AE
VSDFWDRQRAKQDAANPPPQPSEPASGPWWAQGSTILSGRQTVPQEQPQGVTGTNFTQGSPTNYQGQWAGYVPQINGTNVDGHDVSKAQSYKQTELCPECGSSSFMKPSATTVKRCFDCNYTEGRFVHDAAMNAIGGVTGGTRRAAQVSEVRILDSQGRPTGHVQAAQGNRGEITSADQAAGRM